MARGRMISKAISLDAKVNALSDDTARLLWTWLIPHLDSEGRMYGDAQAIKSIVFPRRSISTAKVEKILQQLEEKKLIIRYSVDGNTYLSAPNFEKHQSGIRKDRESPSQIPPFTPDKLQSKSNNSRAEDKGKLKYKYKLKKDKKKYGEYKNVLLTDSEYKRLTDKLGEDEAKKWIETLSRGKELKDYKYKSDYLAIQEWRRRGDGTGTHREHPRAVPKPEDYTDPESLGR